jgi:Prefoldin subunit
MDHDDPTDLRQRIEECSRFIETVVRKDWEAASRDAQRVEDECEEYRDLKAKLAGLQQGGGQQQGQDDGTKASTASTAEAMVAPVVNLGHNRLFCRARVPDASFAYIHVGMGFHVQLTIQEAIQFVDRRLDHLHAVRTHRKDKEKRVRTHLRQSEAILDELTNELQRESQ